MNICKCDNKYLSTYKFLKFACRASILLNFDCLFDRDQLLGYVQKLERSKVGPEGQISKLDAIDAALSFMSLQMLDDDDPRQGKVSRIQATIKLWKATLHKAKTKK